MKIIKISKLLKTAFLSLLLLLIIAPEIYYSANLKAQENLQSQNTSKEKTKSEAKSKSQAESKLTELEKIKIKLQSKEKLTLKEKSELAVQESDMIVDKLKKEMEEYDKIKKNRKPAPPKDLEEESNEVKLIEKFSSSKFLPDNVNENLGLFGFTSLN